MRLLLVSTVARMNDKLWKYVALSGQAIEGPRPLLRQPDHTARALSVSITGAGI
jgi:hypothetical protein